MDKRNPLWDEYNLQQFNLLDLTSKAFVHISFLNQESDSTRRDLVIVRKRRESPRRERVLVSDHCFLAVSLEWCTFIFMPFFNSGAESSSSLLTPLPPLRVPSDLNWSWNKGKIDFSHTFLSCDVDKRFAAAWAVSDENKVFTALFLT